MDKSSGHNVGVADSYAHRTADRVFVQLHLPRLVDPGSAVGLRLVSLGKGAKRQVDVEAEVRPAARGVLLTASVPRAEVEPGRWQVRLRKADGSGYRRARARLLVRPEQPVALMVGPAPLTRMAPPKPRGARRPGGRPAAPQAARPALARGRAQLRRAARAARRLMPSR
jgi:hypothetical protein